ncbi:putative galacturan 1,4-alpha-galacturonidase A [Chaetomidium leptoderma]|uniref:galacturonan 1,4-alpha-galacturonidase n=1 Tax=Chaetomidium leptoderma TaxID=669021 RepID=A0AAN6VPJ4_9PEZI|nr:putative galacturan 1,4-alpha-galacturonidase A [Chaetomidium leptoderma]
MWSPALLLVLSAIILPASTAIVKEGSTCIVTPISDTPAAVALRSIGAVPPTERDLNPEDNPYSVSKPGMPGSLGHYPRPEPGSSSFQNQPISRPRSQPLTLKDNPLEPRQNRPDDTPQILSAFSQCGKDGTIIFREGTYHIRQVMDTTDLRNVSIEIHGTFVWSDDNLSYWRQNSFGVTYAGRQTAWRIGGRDIAMRGFGKALFDGNGQTWIDLARGQGNLNGRPISLTVWHGTNVLIDGITWRMAQFWHTFIAYSQNVTMTNLDMVTFSTNGQSSVNTDGTNTWNSRDITISNWTVKCGDDCIGVKGNSTNVHVSNVVCHESGAMTIGSIGSNSGQPDYVENVVFENITAVHSSNAAWIKTYPGTGHVRNITFRNIQFEDVNQPIYVTSCICQPNNTNNNTPLGTDSYQNCDSSRLPISDVRWENITGTSRYNVAVGIHCSASAPCDGFHFSNIDIKPKNGGTAKVLCSNIKNQASSGLQCTGPCPGSHPQQLSGNV